MSFSIKLLLLNEHTCTRCMQAGTLSRTHSVTITCNSTVNKPIKIILIIHICSTNILHQNKHSLLPNTCPKKYVNSRCLWYNNIILIHIYWFPYIYTVQVYIQRQRYTTKMDTCRIQITMSRPRLGQVVAEEVTVLSVSLSRHALSWLVVGL